ncbi:MAG: HD domain-containing protein [Deltaproteobacteria bacterium]|nr:HD domain-containing protein [Deltaproteobacteria bacterium]
MDKETGARIADLFFELGMLKKTPRTGFRFLGTGGESVAEHSFRATAIGYVLARMHRDVDHGKVCLLCLFHDTPEARTGDLNYVYKKYCRSDEESAVRDMTRGLPFGDDIRSIFHEFNEALTMEAKLARDADQLDLLCNLVEERDLGNDQALDWIPFLLERLYTEEARELAQAVIASKREQWWFKRKGEYWVNAKGPGGP